MRVVGTCGAIEIQYRAAVTNSQPNAKNDTGKILSCFPSYSPNPQICEHSVHFCGTNPLVGLVDTMFQLSRSYRIKTYVFISIYALVFKGLECLPR